MSIDAKRKLVLGLIALLGLPPWLILTPSIGLGQQAPSSVSFPADLLVPVDNDIPLGGLSNLTAVLHLNMPLLRKVLLQPSDLRQATVSLAIDLPNSDLPAIAQDKVHGDQPATFAGPATTLKFYRLLRGIDAPSNGMAPTTKLIPDQDYDSTAISSANLPTLLPGQKLAEITLTDFGKVLPHWLSGEWADHGILVMLDSDDNHTRPRLTIAARTIKGELAIQSYPSHQLFVNPLKPTDGVYTRVVNGHLSYNGKRLRLWGVSAGVDSGNANSAGRLMRLGFNAIRLWGQGGQGNIRGGSPTYDAASGAKGQFRDASSLNKGERNILDDYDKYFAACKKAGLFIECPQLQNAIPWEHLAQDGSFVSGGPDWEQWKAAILTKAPGSAASTKPTAIKGEQLWLAFDERLLQAQYKHVNNFLHHVNPYTGKPYGEEEAVAVWEIHNEHQLLRSALEAGFDTWPEYFRNKLRNRWNNWLLTRYKNDAGLTAAWGKLVAGESLAARNVELAPIFSKREAFPKARGDDFVEFVSSLVTKYYHDYEVYCRSQAPAGVGINVAPFSYDTQFVPNIPWHYSTAAQADVASFGMYFFSLSSYLSAPPSLYVLDSLTVAGKPTVIYETNESRPNPYRTERAFINAALAGWQDWDAIYWHYYHSLDWPDERFLASDMRYMTKEFYWASVEEERDPAMLSALAMAGRLFLNGDVAPAPHPVTYHLGKRAAFTYDLWNGLSTGRATFSRGAGLAYDPQGDFDMQLTGAQPDEFAGRISAAVASGDQLLWDWPNGRLIIDTPQAKAYIGRVPPADGWYRFHDGLAVGGFKNDFVSLALVSADGHALVGSDPASRIYVNARRDAKNTGFDIDMSVAKGPGAFVDPHVQANYIRSYGHAPIVEDNVPFTVCFPTEISGQWRGYDLAMRQVIDRSITRTNQLAHEGSPLFMGTLELSARGKPMQTPQTTLAVVTERFVSDTAPTTRDAALASIWHPLPGISWADSYVRVQQVLRESSLIYTSLSPEESAPAAQTSVRLTEANAVFDLPADITLRFSGGKMQSVDVTFTRPPSLQEAVKAYEDKFGKPDKKIIAEHAFDASTIDWHVPFAGAKLAVEMVDTQGTLSIHYEIQQRD